MAYTPSIPAVGNIGLIDIPKIANNFTALRCNEIGAVEPSNVVQGMWWVDTTVSILKLCLSISPTVWLSVMDFNAAGCTKAHLADVITSSNDVHGIQQGTGNSLDVDKLDGYHITDIYGLNSTNFYDFSTGTDIYHANNDEVIVQSNSMVKIKETRIRYPPSSSLQIYFKCYSEENNGHFQVYNNGSPVGTLHNVNEHYYYEFTELIAGWSGGDRIQVYGYTDSGGSSNYDSKVKDLRILGVCVIDTVNLI